MPNWGLPALSWLISLYFLSGISTHLGFPPTIKITTGHLVYISLWLFFLFLPFFKRIKIGKILELEREVEKTKNDIKEFKEEVRTNLSLISTNVNTIGNMSNQITVNYPAIADIEKLKQQLDKNTIYKSMDEVNDIKDELVLDGDDTIMALARTRIKIESLLRKILSKRIITSSFNDKPIKYMSLQKLFSLFLDRNEDYIHLQEPFSYVVQVCNAAVHAQRVPQSQADEALEIGSRIIAILSKIDAEQA
jgi:hypothetical protein